MNIVDELTDHKEYLEKHLEKLHIDQKLDLPPTLRITIDQETKLTRQLILIVQKRIEEQKEYAKVLH